MTPLESTLSLFSELENKEDWRVVEFFPNYAVSNFGRVKRLTNRTRGKAGAILSGSLRVGYPSVELVNDGEYKTFLVHRLVANAFLPKIPGKSEVNHIDGDRANPKLQNLEWCSRRDNTIHAYRSGFQDASGENNGRSVLTWDQVVKIREIGNGPNRPSFPKIGKMFGVTEATVRGIIRMQTWVSKDCLTRKLHRRRVKNKPMSFFAMAIRNGKQRGAKGKTSVYLLEQKMKFYGWKYRYCGIQLDEKNRSLDHALPIGRGGTNDTANFMPCCRTCNTRKRGKTIFEFLELLREKRKAPMFAVDPAAGQDAAVIQ